MNKKSLAVLISFIFVLVYTSTAFSQDNAFDYKKAYNDHVYSLQLYSDAHDQYLIQKDKYLQFETLASKTDAQEATREMLNRRDESLRVYLSALRIKVMETDLLTIETQQDVLSQLDIEISWYETQKNKYLETDSLEDLINKSNETMSRYETHTKLAIYNSLLEVNSAEVLEIRTEQESILIRLEEKLIEIEENKNKNTQKIATWVGDVKIELEQSKAQEELAKTFYYDEKQSYKNVDKRYGGAFDYLELALTSLEKVDGYFKEILQEIKTAD